MLVNRPRDWGHTIIACSCLLIAPLLSSCADTPAPLDIKPQDGVHIIGLAPTVHLTAPTPFVEGTAVNMFANAQDADGTIATVEWDFDNDGTTDYTSATGDTTFHTFPDNGTYTVTVHAFDNDGNPSGLSSKTFVVKNVAPTILSFAADTALPLGTMEFHATFDDAGVNDAPFHYTIKWGDGSPDYTDVGAIVVDGPETLDEDHVFTRPGPFTVTLKVSDKDGASTTTKIVVGPAIHSPTAVVTVPPVSIEGSTITLSSDGSADPDGLALKYLWDFGDGTTSKLANPTHRWVIHDTYTVKLAVTNAWGATDTTSGSIQVLDAAPTATVKFPTTVNEGGGFAIFVSNAKDPNPVEQANMTFQYDCGDGAGLSTPTTDLFYNCTALGDDGAMAANVVVNSGTAQVSYSNLVLVRNAAPFVFLNLSLTGNPADTVNFLVGESATLGVSINDQGTNDSPFSVHVIWGDGTPSDVTLNTATPAANIQHTWTKGGKHVVKVTVTDKDGGKTTENVTITVLTEPKF